MSSEPQSDGGASCRPIDTTWLDGIVEIHCEAFPESALTVLGARVVRRYYRWQFVGPHPDPVALGVWRCGELVGFLFGGRRRGAVSGFVRSSIPTVLLAAVTHPRALRRLTFPKVVPVMRAVLGLSGRLPTKPHESGAQCSGAEMADPSFGVLSIAVAARELGSGAAGQLLERAESLARKAGYRGMHLTVGAANSRAIHFYLKHGWVRSQPPGEGSLLMVKLFAEG